MTKPWLSVLMPVRNGSAYLRAALDSVVAENEPGVEVVAVDDGSTDDTFEILVAYRDRLELRVYRNARSAGWPASTNRAMGLARGEYHCWLHHDDVWERGRVSTLKEYSWRWPEAAIFLCPVWFIDPQGRRVGRWRCPLPPDRPLAPSFVTPRLLVQNFVATPGPLYKAGVVDSVGRLDERLWYTADRDFWLRAAVCGLTVYCPTTLVGYRIHPASITACETGAADAVRRQYELVLGRYFPVGPAWNASWAEVSRAAHFSARVNVELARWFAGERVASLPLAREFPRPGPRGCRRCVRDSRIWGRALSRSKVRGLSRRARARPAAAAEAIAGGDSRAAPARSASRGDTALFPALEGPPTRALRMPAARIE